MRKLMLVVVLFLMTGSVQANNTLPEAVIGVSPARDWFYNLEDVFFDSGDSSDPNGYISYTKWYINGVLHTSGSYWRNMSECFALNGSPSNGCYELGVGETTVEIELRVQDNSGNWDIETKVITIREYKGRKYFIKDHLGSVRTTVTREDGKVLGYDDYYPFGLSMPGRSSNSTNSNDNYKFTGHERDDEAGLTLDYMMARNYDPMIGRFLQEDPMLQYSSPYTYVGNNPLAYIDPTGMLGDYFGRDGEYYGSDGLEDGKVYVADNKEDLVLNGKEGPNDAEYIGQRDDLLDFNGNTISSEGTQNALIGLSINLKSTGVTEGYSTVTVTSGNRGVKKNDLADGASTSRHISGDAADITVSGVSNAQLARAADNSGLFSSVIHYPSLGSTVNFKNTNYTLSQGTLRANYSVLNAQKNGPHVHVDNRPSGIGLRQYTGHNLRTGYPTTRAFK